MSENPPLVGEMEFRNIADNLPNLCWMADETGTVIYRNSSWYKYCGVDKAEISSIDWHSFYTPEVFERLIAAWEICIATEIDFKEMFPLRGVDGILRFFQTHAVPIRVDGKVVRWLGISVDVTERLRVEKELRESEELLRSLNQTLEIRVEERALELKKTEEQLRQSQKMEAVGQLTGGIAHDFNNILTGIMGNLELLEMKIEQRRFDGLMRFVNNAQESGNRAASLTQRLLAFSRRQTLDLKETSIIKLVNSVSGLIESTIGPGVTLKVNINMTHDVVLIDAPQLENALLNLCINSRDAMPDGGRITMDLNAVTIGPAAAHGFDITPGQYVSIAVMDTGCGMSANTLSKAFDPFFTTKPIGQGTGLGLSMIYGFSRQSKGHVVIESDLDVGTMVTIYLPLCETKTVMKEEVVAIPEIIHKGKGTILLVDDEVIIREMLKEVLEDAGYEIITAEDGIEALKVLESNIHLDLLITDVGLPNGMNGKQVADAARLLRGMIKILFITGYAEKTVMEDKAFDDGIELLTKPFKLHEIVNRSTAMIGR